MTKHTVLKGAVDVWLCTAHIRTHVHTYLNLRELFLRAIVIIQVPSVCANMREGALGVGRRALTYIHAHKAHGKVHICMYISSSATLLYIPGEMC